MANTGIKGQRSQSPEWDWDLVLCPDKVTQRLSVTWALNLPYRQGVGHLRQLLGCEESVHWLDTERTCLVLPRSQPTQEPSSNRPGVDAA